VLERGEDNSSEYTDRIRVMTRRPGHALSRPITVATERHIVFEQAKLRVAVGDDGTVAVAWEASPDVKPTHAAVAVRGPGVAHFSKPIAVVKGERDYQGFDAPAVVAGRGSALVAWVEDNPSDGLQSALRAAVVRGGRLGHAAIVARHADQDTPRLVSNARGRALLTWSYEDGSEHGRVWAALGTVRGGLGKKRALSRGRLARQPYPAIGAGGEAGVIWVEGRDNRPRSVVAALAGSGGRFREPERIERGLLRGPRVAVDAAGRVSALWQSGAGRRTGVRLAAAGAGGSFARPVSLVAARGRLAGTELAASGDNTVALAIQDGGTSIGTDTLWSAVRIGGSPFGAPRALAQTDDESELHLSVPGLSPFGDGGMAALWRRTANRFGTGFLRAALLRP
jgi:hypothetical protein